MTFKQPADPSVEVQIPLPRRSVYVMSGNARMLWQHGIQKGHVQGRRLVVTVRELTEEFMKFDQEPTGKVLMELASNLI